MINGFNKGLPNVNIKYFDAPTIMSDSFFTSKPTARIVKIRFNNLFKNEKLTYAIISIALSVAFLMVGAGIYLVHGMLQKHAYENTSVLSATDLSVDDNIVSFVAIPSSNNNGFGSNTSQSSPNGTNYYGDNLLLADGNTKDTDLKEEILNERRIALAVPETYNPNPFLPYNEKVTHQSIVEQTNATNKAKLIRTVISGIMYDKYSPSAIINIEGTDYLAKKGDVINSYKILNITQDTVTVKLGNNVYKAGVGEILAQGRIHYNSVPNLDKRFGGAEGIDAIIMKHTKK